jgi:bacterioferritin-associated ferredoxin
MTSGPPKPPSRPPKIHRAITREVDAEEVRRMAAASTPCAGCAELAPVVESLRANLQQERTARARLETTLTSALAQIEDLRLLVREAVP